MSDEVKTHTQGEVDILTSLTKIKTLLNVLNKEFNEHKKDDDGNFGSMDKSIKDISDGQSKLPEKLTICSEKLKTELLTISRREFVNDTDFKVFKTKIITWGIAAGVIAGVVGKIIDWSLKLMGV